MNDIKRLEKTARLLDPDAKHREALLNRVVGHTEKYLKELERSPAYVLPPAVGYAPEDISINEDGIDIETALALIEENVDAVGVNPTSGRFLGYIPGGGLFYSALGDYLAAVSNRFAGLYFVSPGAVRMENLLIQWMARQIGYPEMAGGNLTSGGSIANLTAIVTARDACEITGEKISKSVVYVTEHVHHCIDKALHVAGLDSCIQHKVGFDSGYRMDVRDLKRAIADDKKAGLRPWLIVASAGTTNTGSVDPLMDIGDIAAVEDLWFHVDGAYGGLFALCPEGKAVLKGMDRSDSIVLDPHKALFLPYGTGTLLVKDRQKLYAAFNAEADYLQNILDATDELSPADLSIELTRHFRGLRLWLPLKLLGAAVFRAALSEKIHLARYFYEKVKEIDGFETGPSPDLSVVTYRYVPKKGDADAFNNRLMQNIQHEGQVFISSTRVDDKLVLRAAILCFRTHLDDIQKALEILERTARQLESG